MIIVNDSNEVFYSTAPDSPAAQSPIITSKVKELVDSLSSTSSLPSFLNNCVIPPGLLYADNNIFIFEKPPANKNIFIIPQLVDSIEDTSSQEVYNLPLPWQVYVATYSSYFEDGTEKFQLNDVYFYFSNSSITDFSQDIYLPPIPNIYSNGKLCRPMLDNIDDVIPYTNDISGLMSLAYNWIWNSGTNLDLTEACLQMYTQSFARTSFSDNISSLFLSSSVFEIFNPTYSFYIDYKKISQSYSAWEKLSIEDVLSLEWPNPSPKDRFHTTLSQHMSSIEYNNYISNSEDGMYSNSECCEYCQYFDEDGDPIENECSYEDCDCHAQRLHNTTIYKALHSTNFYRKITLLEILNIILSDFSSNFSLTDPSYYLQEYSFALS